MASFGDPLNQKKVAMVIVHGPSDWGERGTIGVKLLLYGRQYGFVLDQAAAKQLGLVIALDVNDSTRREVEVSELVPGGRPVTIVGEA